MEQAKNPLLRMTDAIRIAVALPFVAVGHAVLWVAYVLWPADVGSDPDDEDIRHTLGSVAKGRWRERFAPHRH